MVGVKDEWTEEGKRFMKALRELGSLEVRVGYQHGKEQEDDGTDICDIAMFNELGTVNIPSRPFLRDSVDKHIPAINHMLAEQEKVLLSGGTAKEILNTVGLFQKDLIQTEIEQGDFIANAPETIRRKGSEKPLIDTGRLKNSVNYQIVKKGECD